MIDFAAFKNCDLKEIAKILGIKFVKKKTLWILYEIPKYIDMVGGRNATYKSIANHIFLYCPYWKESTPPCDRTVRRYLAACKLFKFIERSYEEIEGKIYRCKRIIRTTMSKVLNKFYVKANEMFRDRDPTMYYFIDPDPEKNQVKDDLGKKIALYDKVSKWQILSSKPNLICGIIAV